VEPELIAGTVKDRGADLRVVDVHSDGGIDGRHPDNHTHTQIHPRS